MEAILVKIVNVKIANIRSCIVCVLDDWVLNTHLWFLIVIIYIVLIVSMCILLFQNFQDCDVVEDCSFDSYRTEVLIMQNPVHWFALQTWKELRSFFIFEIRIFFLFLDPKCICSLCLKILLLVLQWSFLWNGYLLHNSY